MIEFAFHASEYSKLVLLCLASNHIVTCVLPDLSLERCFFRFIAEREVRRYNGIIDGTSITWSGGRFSSLACSAIVGCR